LPICRSILTKKAARKRRTAFPVRLSSNRQRKLGARESFNGGFVIDPPDAFDNRPEYGPFEIEKGQNRIMRSSSEGYRPIKSDHIRQSELCTTCTSAKALGRCAFASQEWLTAIQDMLELPTTCHASCR